MLHSFQDSSTALNFFIIVITDMLKYVFIDAEDLAFNTNIQISHDHMRRWVCFSHYPDAGFLTYGNMVSFSSAQSLFVLFDASAFSFLLFLYEAYHWVMEFPDCSSHLIFFSLIIKTSIHNLLFYLQKTFQEIPTSVCCVLNFCNYSFTFSEYFFCLIFEHTFLPYPILVSCLK